MYYNVYLEFSELMYPRMEFAISLAELKKLTDAYEEGLDKVFIRGENIHIKNPNKIKVFNTEKIVSMDQSAVKKSITDRFEGINMLGIDENDLDDFGREVTNDFIFGPWGTKSPELFNLYIKTGVVDNEKIQIKHGLSYDNIQQVLLGIKNGERNIFVDGTTLLLENLITIKIFDVSRADHKYDKGNLKSELNQYSSFFKSTGLNLLKDKGKEVTHKFKIEKPAKINTSIKTEIFDMKKHNDSEKKLFISHASKDASKIKPLIDLLENIGVKHNQIFYSSSPAYGVTLGENIFDRLKKELNDNVLALFILSENFYASPVCLCEMGAVWIKSNKQIPILIPPFDFGDVKGVFTNSLGFKIDDKAQLSSFKIEIEKYFSLTPIHPARWEEKRDEYLSKINEIK